jgi:ABC-type antimicrobial peptide transport system permease subunit
MGRLYLVARLAARDLKHRPGAAVLLLIALVTATATLTMGLVLHGTTSQPYATTQAATNGPDIVAQQTPDFAQNTNRVIAPPDLKALTALTKPGEVAGEPKVTAYSGPFPYTFARLTAGGHIGGALVEGRTTTASAVDQPDLTAGTWIRPGEVVIERSFADALGVGPGARITLNGRTFTVAGIAVSAAIPAYPRVCWFGCNVSSPLPSNALPGLIWLTESDARSLVTAQEPLNYVLNIKLSDPTAAEAFASTYDNNGSQSTPYLMAWQDISAADARLVEGEQQVLSVGSWLLGLLALATVVVLVGGRMAAQIGRVGVLKAAGASPGLVAAVLLVENVTVALVAAVVGLLIGWLTAPLLTNLGAGLVGTAGTPAFTLATVGLVVGAALGVAVVATGVPAIRAARTSTVSALTEAGTRRPRRRALLIMLSARLPVPLLLGLRLLARRPRRALLSTASILVTATGIVAVLLVHARMDYGFTGGNGLDNPQDDRLSQAIFIISVVLLLLAIVNALLITWATVLDARNTSALARALGATPSQVSAGLCAAQILPALVGALLGIPGGIGLVEAVSNSGSTLVMPPDWWLIAEVLGVVLGIAVVTFIPAWIGARRAPADVLRTEMA